MIHVGIAGIGFMGMVHYLSYRKLRGVRVTAVCSRDQKKLTGDWRGIKGNFGPPGTRMDLSGVAAYDDIDAMLADSKIDLVDICLPPAMHEPVAIAAVRAGKHVFCEKPMALTAAACRRMTRTAERAGRLLMVGHVLPFFPEYAAALKLIRDEKYGRAIGGQFRRTIADPLWIDGFYDPRRVGGPMLDLNIHDAHFIRLAFGMPTAVTSQGRMRGDVVEYATTLFHSADSRLAVSAAGGVVDQQGRSFTHGFEIHLERATLLYEFAVIDGQPRLLMPLTILDDRGKAIAPKLSGTGDPMEAFAAELAEVVAGVRSGKPSTILDARMAEDAVEICEKVAQSVRRGKRVKVKIASQ